MEHTRSATSVGSGRSASPPRPRLEAITQERYERSMKQELEKLTVAIADDRMLQNSLKAQKQADLDNERKRKEWEAEKAEKMRAMEQAIIYAQKMNQKEFLRKRAAGLKKMKDKDAAANAQLAAIKAREDEKRQQQAAAHDAKLAAENERRAQGDQGRRDADAKREARLRHRMEQEREALEERNSIKAEIAAAKIEHAAELRSEMEAKQRADFARKEREQRAREAAAKAEHDRQVAEKRARADAKHRKILAALEGQRQLQEGRKNKLLSEEAERQQRFEIRAAREAEARRRQQHESSMQAAAARSRAEGKLNELQDHLSDLEGRLDNRKAKLMQFAHEKQMDQDEGQRLAVRLSTERAMLGNSMAMMRSDLGNTRPNSIVVEMKSDRRANLKDPELKNIFERVDPKAEGHISLPVVKKTLVKLLPPEPAFTSSHSQRPGKSRGSSRGSLHSASMPTLLPSEKESQSSRCTRSARRPSGGATRTARARSRSESC